MNNAFNLTETSDSEVYNVTQLAKIGKEKSIVVFSSDDFINTSVKLKSEGRIFYSLIKGEYFEVKNPDALFVSAFKSALRLFLKNSETNVFVIQTPKSDYIKRRVMMVLNNITI